MNAFLRIGFELVQQLVEHILLVNLVHANICSRWRSGGNKIERARMMVGVQAIDDVDPGVELCLMYGGDTLYKGREGGNVGVGVEGFAVYQSWGQLVQRFW